MEAVDITVASMRLPCDGYRMLDGQVVSAGVLNRVLFLLFHSGSTLKEAPKHTFDPGGT